VRLVRIVVAEAPASGRGAARSLLCQLCRDDLGLGFGLGEFLDGLGLGGLSCRLGGRVIVRRVGRCRSLDHGEIREVREMKATLGFDERLGIVAGHLGVRSAVGCSRVGFHRLGVG